MSYLLVYTAVFACMIWLVYVTACAVEKPRNIPVIIVALASWAAFIAGIAFGASKAEEKGPCAQYETQLYYNAATKTMMPAKVCVLRGEWVEEGEE